MNTQKGFFTKLGELIDQHTTERRSQPRQFHNRWFSRLLPSPGNVIFTLLLIGGLLWGQNVGVLNLFAAPNAQNVSTGTIPYQGRLADAAGEPLTETVNMSFRLYNAASGGAPLWTEQWTGSNGVQVSDGLFNVMLGSLTTIEQGVITGNNNLFLGITVGTDDEMTPRVQLGSVPYAVQALTVPDGSITPAKLELPHGYYSTSEWFSTTSVDFVPITDALVEITVDSTSQILIIFAGDILVNQNGAIVEIGVGIDGTVIDPPKIEYVRPFANVRITGSQSVIAEVKPGTHIVQLYLRSNNGSSTASIGHRSLSVVAID